MKHHGYNESNPEMSQFFKMRNCKATKISNKKRFYHLRSKRYYPWEVVLQKLFLFLCRGHQSKNAPQSCHEPSHGNGLPLRSSRQGKHFHQCCKFGVSNHTTCCQWLSTSCGTSCCSSTWLVISGTH